MADGFRDISPKDQWSDKLLKLLPAEVTGVYLFARSVWDVNNIEYDKNILYIFLCLTVLLPLFNAFALRVSRLRQNAVMTVSFVIWAINIDSVRLARSSMGLPAAGDLASWAPILMGVWVAIIVPIIFSNADWAKNMSATPAVKAEQPTGGDSQR